MTAMVKKKSKKTQQEAENSAIDKADKRDITMEETEADVALGTEFVGDAEDLNKAVKRDSEKGRAMRVLIPLLFFLIIGALVGYATWYYTRPERTETSKTVEEKIQTPPVIIEDNAVSEEVVENKEDDTTPSVTASEESSSVDYISYTVKSGDTLSGIANDHGLTSTELADYNNLDDVHSLQIGQTIKIPQ